MVTRIGRDGFQALFDGFGRSAWRLEMKGWYDEPDEAELVKQWVIDNDHTQSLTWFADWPAWVAEQVTAGKEVGRVRVLTDPLTSYLKWQLSVISEPAIAAGEDIRVLPATVAATLDLGVADFWLFDDELGAVLEYGRGRVTGARLVDDAGGIAALRAIRAVALDHALSFAAYRHHGS